MVSPEMLVDNTGWGERGRTNIVSRCQLEPNSCLWAEDMFRTPSLSVLKTKFDRALRNLM